MSDHGQIMSERDGGRFFAVFSGWKRYGNAVRSSAEECERILREERFRPMTAAPAKEIREVSSELSSLRRKIFSPGETSFTTSFRPIARATFSIVESVRFVDWRS